MNNNQKVVADSCPSVSVYNVHNNKSTLSDYLRDMDVSICSHHPSLSLVANPVIRNLTLNGFKKKQIETILIQYCFLPAEIVNLLSTARNSLSFLPSISAELTRNINEEKGSRTNGISHYEILARTLNDEIGLEIHGSEYALLTYNFLHTIKEFLALSAFSVVAGAIYAMENAAVPELFVVAELINHYALSTGHSCPVITLPPERLPSISRELNYSLNVFFGMHLLDFEVGHKNGLALAIKNQHATTPFDLSLFESGFEFVLDQMDVWWEALACLEN